ncbi:tetratricopeptide repeat protein [Microvirga soli]|uniref:tetratricopeptide repeat protein n=1 Tax=Microvirga soli TaxID=1854496 RepID=UPI00191D50F7|nr:tetratricopeptide repeat protein [Microvirga soli]
MVRFAEEHVRRAALLDELETWLRLATGLVHSRRREPEQAIAALETAIKINPNFAPVHAYLGYTLAMSGNHGASIEALDRAIRLSPRDPFLTSEYATIRPMADLAAGNYEEVILVTRRFILDRPNYIGRTG